MTSAHNDHYPALVGFLMLALTILPSTSLGQDPSADTMMPVGIIGEPAGTGAYPAIAESFASMRNNTVYRPSDLPDTPLPLVLWGNGGCRDNGLNNGAFLREVASHGFIIVAAGYPRLERGLETTPSQGSTTAEPPPSPPPSGGRERQPDPTQPKQLIDAIDWMRSASQDASSPLYQHVDLENIGVMGHSCGGLQAIVIGADARIDTAIIFNSGVYNDGPDSGRSGISVTKSQLRDLHGPVAYINGGPSDIAYRNAVNDFERINHVPIFFGENGVGHSGTFWSAANGGKYAQVATAWMAWHLRGDAESAGMFIGEDCGLCIDPDWGIRRKGID